MCKNFEKIRKKTFVIFKRHLYKLKGILLWN